MNKADMLRQFGRVLINDVRDRSIDMNQKLISGELKGVRAAQIAEKLGDLSSEQIRQFCEIMPFLVDTTLHNLLEAIEEQGSFEVKADFGAEGEVNLSNESDGLSGELYGRRGWISLFSKFPDLNEWR